MTTECLYNLKEFPLTVKTVGLNRDNLFMGLSFTPEGTEVPIKHTFARVPAIGERVEISMNNLGSGTVEAYFVEHQYAGVQVRLDVLTRPAWHRRQEKANSRFKGCALVFGAELKRSIVA